MNKKLGSIFTVVEGVSGHASRHNLNGLTTVFMFCIWEFINRKLVQMNIKRPQNKIAIFSKTCLTILIIFQSFMEAVSKNITT
jgi:hypothetical protein